MKKNNLISFLVLFVVLGYAFYHGYFSKVSVNNEVVTVIINDEGFSPDRIVVSQGATVIFLNQGERLHWPASNPHPAHTLYPKGGGCIDSSFDACRGLKKGESFSFKFDILGQWPAHDHLFPGHLMVVNVKEDINSNSNKDFIYNGKLKVEDFKKLEYGQELDFIKMMSKDNPAKAWSYIKQVFIVNGQVVGNAHEFSHIIGNTSYEKFGLDGIKICDDTFAFGCFHGVTEQMLLKEGTKRIKDIEVGCLKLFPPDISQGYTGCIHGTGHGVFTLENGNLNKSLQDCDNISETYKSYCYDGVFMENSTQPESRVVDVNNPWKLCANLDEHYHRNCARYQSQIFLDKFGTPNSVSVVGENCGKAPSLLMKETCYESLGYYIAQTSLGKIEDIWNTCSSIANSDGKAICTTGSAIESVFQRYGDFSKSAHELCNRLVDPRKSLCLNSINRMIK